MSYITKSQSNVIQDILINLVENVPDITDINVGSIIRQLAEALGIEVSVLYTDLDIVYNGTRLASAMGDDLDNLGLLVGITRRVGTKSEGYVTFLRNQPTGTPFVITQNSTIGTQPNTSTEQQKFIVKVDTTFPTSITNEAHSFADGIYYYKMDERFANTVTDITGTASGSPYTFVATADYNIISDYEGLIVDVSTITNVDDCETADWSESADATADALDGADYKEGSNSLLLGKSGTTTNYAKYYKIITSVSGANKKLLMYLKIKDSATKSKLAQIDISFGTTNDSNVYTFTIPKASLTIGWDLYSFDYTSTDVTVTGSPLITGIDYAEIKLITTSTSDTLTSGDVKMDFWFFSEANDYVGDIVEFVQTGTLPDDGTDFFVDYVPLSKEVLCESEDIGTDYNVDIGRIIYKVSSIPNVDNVYNYVAQTGGTDEESDDALRERIQNASSASGKATSESLRQAVLAIPGIISVNVDDTPLKQATNEPHVYNSTTKKFKLDYEIAIDNANLLISDTYGGGADYIKGTDYVLNTTTNEIDFNLGGSEPINGNTVYTTYDYNWLGHADLYAAGTAIPMPSTLLNSVVSVVNETKSAGITVSVSEPTVINVSVTATITVESGYVATAIKNNVKETLTNYLDAINIGVDVYLAKLIDIAMGVEGVENISITTPASDVSIGANEIARPNVITIN